MNSLATISYENDTRLLLKDSPAQLAVMSEVPGLTKMLALNGINDPFQRGLLAGGNDSFNDIYDEIFDPDSNLANLINIIKNNDNNEDILNSIRISRDGSEIDDSESSISILDAINILEQSEGGDGASEIVNILIDELKEKIEPDTTIDDALSKIQVSGNLNRDRIIRLAQIMGIDPLDIETKSLGQILTYFSELSKRVDDITDFKAAEIAFHIDRSYIYPEVKMLEEVVPQHGVECVLYSALNVANAAKSQNANLIEDVTIEEMQQIIPKGEGTNYRQMRGELTNYLRSKGLHASTNFTWGEALKALQDKTGAMILRLSADHAVAVVGIRHRNIGQDDAPVLEFCIANSLSTYEPIPPDPKSPVWVDANEIITHTQLRKVGEEVNSDKLLITWNKNI